jgi:hypothetical protein
MLTLASVSLKKHLIATPGRKKNAGQVAVVPYLLLIKHSFSPLAPPAADERMSLASGSYDNLLLWQWYSD